MAGGRDHRPGPPALPSWCSARFPTRCRPFPLPVCADSATACAPDHARAMNASGIAAEQAATVAGGGYYADLTSLFCTASRCPVIIGNNLVFRDDNHLTSSYAQWLAPVASAEISSAMAGSSVDRPSTTPDSLKVGAIAGPLRPGR
ncbi:MAG: SGNH hydrolase domain-containing protein [Pseudonocardiaceae bacterium]